MKKNTKDIIKGILLMMFGATSSLFLGFVVMFLFMLKTVNTNFDTTFITMLGYIVSMSFFCFYILFMFLLGIVDKINELKEIINKKCKS